LISVTSLSDDEESAAECHDVVLLVVGPTRKAKVKLFPSSLFLSAALFAVLARGGDHRAEING
jgi:hypothetical protein